MFLEVEIFGFHHGFVKFSGTLHFFHILNLYQGHTELSNALASKTNLFTDLVKDCRLCQDYQQAGTAKSSHGIKKLF